MVTVFHIASKKVDVCFDATYDFFCFSFSISRQQLTSFIWENSVVIYSLNSLWHFLSAGQAGSLLRVDLVKFGPEVQLSTFMKLT